MTNFVTLATFTYPHEFVVLKLLLEQEDLRFFFQNEMVIGIIPFYSNALGGIFLKVHPQDVPTALKIIRHLQNDGHLKIV